MFHFNEQLSFKMLCNNVVQWNDNYAHNIFKWEGTSIQWPNQNNGHLVLVSSIAHLITFTLQNKGISSSFLNLYECSLWGSPRCEHFEGSIDYPFQTQFLQFVEFLVKKSIQKSISSTPYLWTLWNKFY